jgi:hypothetical protein
MTMHIAIVHASEVSPESKAFHLSKEIRVIGQCVFKRAMPLAGLPHEDASAFFYDLRFNDSRVVSEMREINLTFEDCVHCFKVAVRAQ